MTDYTPNPCNAPSLHAILGQNNTACTQLLLLSSLAVRKVNVQLQKYGKMQRMRDSEDSSLFFVMHPKWAKIGRCPYNENCEYECAPSLLTAAENPAGLTLGLSPVSPLLCF
jgi:hypothetical protein